MFNKYLEKQLKELFLEQYKNVVNDSEVHFIFNNEKFEIPEYQSKHAHVFVNYSYFHIHTNEINTNPVSFGKVYIKYLSPKDAGFDFQKVTENVVENYEFNVLPFMYKEIDVLYRGLIGDYFTTDIEFIYVLKLKGLRVILLQENYSSKKIA